MSVIDHNASSYHPWPLTKFFFRVTIGGAQISFQSAEGLESEISVIEYRGGDYALWSKTKRPGMISYSNLSLKKGMFKGDSSLHDWWKSYASSHSHGDRKEIKVELMDSIGDGTDHVYITWTLKNAFVIKYTSTPMDAEADSEPAIEEMDVAFEVMEIDIS